MPLSLFLLCLSYVLFITGYAPTRGFFSLPSLLVLGGALLCATALLRNCLKPGYLSLRSPSQTVYLLYIVVVFSLIQSIIYYGGLYQSGPFISMSILLLGLALYLVLYLINRNASIRFPTRLTQSPIAIIIGIAFLIRLLMIWSSPSPHIDAYYILKEGSSSLLLGKNPYQQMFTVLYPGIVPNYFTYLPATLLLILPFIMAFSDPRYAFVFSDLLTITILMHSSRKKSLLIPLVLIFLFSPMALYVLEQSYADIFLNTFFLGSLIFWIKKRYSFQALWFGIFLALKTINISLLPFLLIMRGRKLRYLFLTLFTYCCFLLPFFLWSPKDFLADVVGTHLYNPFPVYANALSYPVLLHYLVGWKLEMSHVLPILLSLYGIVLWILRNQTQPALFALTAFYWLFAFTLFGTQAFVNNYYFIGNVLVFTLATMFSIHGDTYV